MAQNFQIEGLENDKELDTGKYFLYSVIKSKKLLNTNTFGIKIKRFEDKLEVANKKCDVMGKIDKYCDIIVGVTGHLHPVKPTNGQIENQKYRDEKLDKFMKKVHESEKKEFTENTETSKEYEVLTDDDDEKDFECENYGDTYLFSNEDCLDEDKIIPEQRFAVVSFYTPDFVKNLKYNLFKVRGYTNTYEKADKMSKEFENLDCGKFNIGVVEIGKWTPINFANMKSRKTQDRDTQMKIMQKELQELNELVGRYKKNLDGRKDLLDKRKKEEIKKAAENLNNDDKEEYQQIQQTDEVKEVKELGKNKEATKERLQQTIERMKKAKENKVSENNENNETSETNENNEIVENTQNKEHKEINFKNTNRDFNSRIESMKKKLNEMKSQKQETNKSNVVDDTKITINKEVVRINEKKQNLENLKEDKEKLEEKLKKMREMLNSKSQ